MSEIVIKEPKSKLKNFLLGILDLFAFLVFIVWLFLFIKLFIVAPVVVKGHSMLPNYHEWDYIFVDKFYRKISWWIKRWDVVVVMPEVSNVSFLKRVIWLPWETIEIKSWAVYLCGDEKYWENYKGNDYYENKKFKDGNLICKQLKEEYIAGKTVNVKWYPEKIVTRAKCWISKFRLWPKQYLVFGDDRMYSTDSRCCFKWYCLNGQDIYYITEDEILGRVWSFKH
jgi:signal peptidase I